MSKKILILRVALIMCLGLFSGYRKKARLSDEQELKVKQTGFEYYSKEMLELTLEEVYFYYYGTFNESIVIMFFPDTGGRIVWSDILDIQYSNTNFIQVWSNGALYRLDEAQDKGLLTEENLKQIAKIHEKDLDNIYRKKTIQYN